VSEVDGGLIQWICVREAHRHTPPPDQSTPFNIHEEGGWAYCPAGATQNHLWYRTGGITRAGLDRFAWPREDEVDR
jgi:hypothetical protein